MCVTVNYSSFYFNSFSSNSQTLQDFVMPYLRVGDFENFRKCLFVKSLLLFFLIYKNLHFVQKFFPIFPVSPITFALQFFWVARNLIK